MDRSLAAALGVVVWFALGTVTTMGLGCEETPPAPRRQPDSNVAIASKERAVPSRASPIEVADGLDTERMKVMLDSGVDVNTRDERGMTLLHHAVTGKPHSRLKDFGISGTREGNAKLRSRYTDQRIRLASLLLDRGADIDARTDLGLTPLHISVLALDLDLVRFFASRGANLDLPKKNGGPPLCSAIEIHDEEFAAKATRAQIDLLLELGAGVNASCRDGSPLQLAIKKGAEDLALTLVTRGAKSDAVHYEETPLLIALRRYSSNRAVFKRLLDEGADIHWKNSEGEAAIHFAAGYGELEALRLLLARGAKPEAQNKKGETPLMFSRNPETAQILLDSGAKIDASCADGRTLLHRAVDDGEIGMVAFLLKKGARIDVRDSLEYTPLFLADEPEIIRLLVKHGARVQRRGWNKWTPLHHQADHCHTEAVACLLDLGASIKARAKNGDTPLHLAAGCREPKTAEILIDRGAALTARNRHGRTPLDMAQRRGRDQVSAFLISKVATKRASRNAGQAPP